MPFIPFKSLVSLLAEAIELTTEAHSKRLVMREKWRRMGSPQTFFQKKFVHKMFTNLFFFKAYRTGATVGFSNYSFHEVTVCYQS